jgi:CheY-like chemotaxis protein
MTANIFPEQITRCMEAGMDGHLGKPIYPAKINKTLAFWSTQSDIESGVDLGDKKLG